MAQAQLAPSRRPIASGRYSSLETARMPATGLAVANSRQRVHTTVASVEDPYDAKSRLLVTVNRRVDLLEVERSGGHIGEAEYRAGRLIQAVLERGSGVGKSNWIGNTGGGGDPVLARELGMIYAMEDAAKVRDLELQVVAAIGMAGCRILRKLLTGEASYLDIGIAAGKGDGDRSRRFGASLFRHHLSNLAEHWAAVGRPRRAAAPAE